MAFSKLDQKRKHSELLVEGWNARHQGGSGIEVTVLLDNGELMQTRTKSPAFVTDASGIAVIFVEGIRGYYLLTRVTPREVMTNERI